jgi:uncharacterized membrane protein
MTDQKAQPAQVPAFRTNRVEAFSDGVFAIAITLLVLELAVPAGSEHDLWGAVMDEWPSYLAYLVSFSTVGAVWVGHTVITECLARATPVLIRLNLLLLMVGVLSAISDQAFGRVRRRGSAGAGSGYDLWPQSASNGDAFVSALALRGTRGPDSD